MDTYLREDVPVRMKKCEEMLEQYGFTLSKGPMQVIEEANQTTLCGSYALTSREGIVAVHSSGPMIGLQKLICFTPDTYEMYYHYSIAGHVIKAIYNHLEYLDQLDETDPVRVTSVKTTEFDPEEAKKWTKYPF